MTSQGGGPHGRGEGARGDSGSDAGSGAGSAWQAVFGDVNDPTDPRFAAEYAPPTRPPRRWAHLLRTTGVTVLILGVLVGVVVAFVGRGNTSSPQAGLSVSAPITPSSIASTGPSSSASTAAQAQDIRLAQALLVNTSWAQLAPYLQNLATSGVAGGCLNVVAHNEAQCRFGAKAALHHAVLLGDAAALDWLPAVVAELAPHGWDVQVLTYADCPVSRVAITVNGALDDQCADHRAFITAQLAALKPTLIIGSDSDSDLALATAPPKPKGAPREKPAVAFTAGLSAAVSAYKAYGKVVLIASAPGGKDVTDCQAAVALPKACVSAVRPAWQAYQALERAALKGQADYIDPTAAFCHDQRCPAVVGTSAVYTNGTRMTEAWSRSLGYLFAAYVGTT